MRQAAKKEKFNMCFLLLLPHLNIPTIKIRSERELQAKKTEIVNL